MERVKFFFKVDARLCLLALWIYEPRTSGYGPYPWGKVILVKSPSNGVGLLHFLERYGTFISARLVLEKVEFYPP